MLLTIRAAAGGTRYIVCSCHLWQLPSILLYLSSTLYHSLGHTRAYRVMRALDHGSIYLLIAGTYTPFTLIGLRGSAGLDAVRHRLELRPHRRHRQAFPWASGAVSTAMYLAMGWACIFAVKPMYLLLAHPVFGMLIAGGVCYSAGIPFYASRRRYMHFIWHLWVLAGTSCHFAAIWLLIR